MNKTEYDIAIIGGGINGVGIARDAAGRGLKVLLAEQHDLAQHTSSASTKLIHGGLRYLEHMEFMLVRKALLEREVILRSAPHITWPLRFVMPHDPAMRPAWMIRAGIFLYDHLAPRDLLPDSEVVNLRHHESGEPLSQDYQRGFIYSDGWVDDARLVVLNALDAREMGADIRVQTRVIGAERYPEHWTLTLAAGSEQQSIQARAVVNAAGPWAAQLLGKTLQVKSQYHLRLVKGSHIVVPKLYDHTYAYLFQNPDKRIIFAIPYEQQFTLIGTTDVEFTGDPASVQISPAEIDYLCAMSNRYFNKQLSPADIRHTYAGVRPLLEDAQDDASAVTRDYALELDTAGPPLLTVWGGKITTYRKLAEQAVRHLQPALENHAPDWTQQGTLPGGAFEQFDKFCAQTWRHYPWMEDALLLRLCRAYGTRIHKIFAGCETEAAAGQVIARHVYARELDYLVHHEFARTAHDILWRRSKLGLHLTPTEQAAIDTYLQSILPHSQP
ncbi:glycerol-3-phosphate dehydrogenase [Parvibium lacunae]|uniref:Glycerol-3-phosphate dehydrogenase n=1 Tax=Parvibium lacunae TaxID=1888893 RepID=A0A368L4F3_9BURK|nr:glycerol-3-phosphate dehydrogenase [Parvibium lacunae]RCS58466.1 glycerol-3-phosphate dehydrogenase [Parvibium lacunae]